MLQALREKTSGLIAKIVLGALIFVFSFFGIESYFIAHTDTWVAKVGSKEITPDQFTQRFNEYRQQMMRMMGAQFDGSQFERPESKRQVLDNLIDEQLVLAANEELGLRVTDQRVRQEILDIPAFQTGGKFDDAIYKATLSAQGMSPLGFQERVRQDLAVRELPSQIAATSVVTAADIDAYIKLRDQTRDADYVVLPKPVVAPQDIADADIESYYKAHASEFVTPEQVALEYVEMDAASMKLDAAVDDAAIKERYEKDKARYVSPEQRLASHILIKVAKNADAEAQKKALAKAQDLASQAKAGKDFAALAKQSSDDLGSRAQGGDLGWLEKGVTDPAFEAALFGMEKGAISDPVLSAEGYHVILLRDVRAEHVRALEEVKGEIAKELQETERERAFNEVAGKLTDAVNADPSSLENVAKKLGLEIRKTGLITRRGGEGIAANPAVVKAAFSEAVLVGGNVSDPVDLGPNHRVVVRVAEHKPSTPKPLDAVREDVRSRLVAEKTATLAREQAEGLAKRLTAGETLEKLAAESKLKLESAAGLGRNAANVDSQLVAELFKLARPAEGKPSTGIASLADHGYALLQLKAVHDGDPAKVDTAGRDQVRQQLQQIGAIQAERAFIASLRQQTKIEIAEDRMP